VNTLTLINTTRRMKIYNLPHDTYCSALGRCACTRLDGRQARLICASITIPAGGFVNELPKAVFEVAEIQRDLKVGHLRAHHITQPEKKTSKTRKAGSKKNQSGSGRKRAR
jgi:hypothetical protein